MALTQVTEKGIKDGEIVNADINASAAITYSKIQDVSATDRILGRDTAGAGDIEEITPANIRTMLNVEDGADVTDATNVDAAGAVMNADLDVKGELLVGDGSGDPTALAVGTNDHVLTAASGEATGVKWAALPASGAALTGSTNNTVVTVTGSNAIAGEADFTYDGTKIQATTDTSDNNTELLRLENSHTDGKMTVIGFKTDGNLAPQTKIYGGNDNTGDGGQAGDSGAGKFKVTISNPSGTHQNVIYAENDGSSRFTSFACDGTDRMKIFEDNIKMWAVDSNTNNGILQFKKIADEGTPGIRWVRAGAYSGWGTACDFVHNATQVGSIKYSTGSTQFNTSSDYRLKENIINLTGAIDRVKQLAPKRFNFKIDSSVTIDGFLAHEVNSIVPEAVSGTKDAVEPEDDDKKGVKKGDIIPQGIDQSKIVPLLTAALQEAIAKIETLETKVAALEAG